VNGRRGGRWRATRRVRPGPLPCSDAEARPRLFDVAGDLGAQGVDRLEALLFPELSFEGEIDLDPVDLAREIDDVRLRNEIPPVAEGRTEADVGHDRKALPGPGRPVPNASQVPEIDTGRRQDFRFRSQICCRESDCATAPIALDHLASCTEGSPEKQRRLLDVTVGEEFPNPGRVHVSTLHLHFRDNRDREAEMRAALGEHPHRAFPVPPEMKVVADVDLDRTNPLVDMMSDESLGTDLGERAIEGLGDHGVDPESLEGFDLLFEGVEEPQIRLGLEHAPRMGLEGIENRLAAERPRPLDHELQDRLVSQMYAIEISERQNGANEFSTQIRNAVKDLQVQSPSARIESVRILSHYFVARFLGLFTTVLVASFIVLATIELVLNLDDLSAFGATAADPESASPFRALRYLWVRLASYYLADLLPLASFIAVFITFAWAGRSMELVALQAGGVRLHRAILPVLATALILSLATAILHETLILRAQQVWASEAEGSHDQPDFGREAFWYHRGRMITNITSADPEARTLHGVEIFERTEGGRVTRVIRTDRVQVDAEGVWHMDAADVWTFDAEDTTRKPQFDAKTSLALHLDARQAGALLGADPGMLPIRDLAHYLEANPKETPSNLRRLQARFHDRLSSPWLVVLFGWLALPFALRVDQRGRIGGPAAAAVATLGGFFLLRSAGATISRQEFLPVGITPWIMLAIAFAATGIALRVLRR
jgi:lipopolysaccharide export system permease protein